MIKKVNKIVLIIILSIFFIITNWISSYALTSDDEYSLSAGDTLKIKEGTYSTILKKNGWWYVQEQGSTYFNKGEIVTYTGTWRTDAHANFKSTDEFVEVESGNKKGLVKIDKVDKYKTKIPERPATITSFISKYKVDTMKENEYNTIIRNYRDEDNLNYSSMDSIDDFISSIDNMEKKDRKEAISKLEGKYKEIASVENIPVIAPNDSNFMIQAYKLAWKYKEYKKADEVLGDTDENTDWASKFDEAYESYNNATKDSDKAAYRKVIEESWQNMSESERDANSRREKYAEVEKIESDKEMKNQDEEDSDKSITIYKYPNKIETSSAGSLDDMIGDADKFINSTNDTAISSESLQDFSKTFYNIFLTIGIIVAVLVGSILGIKFMVGGAEEKANVKELLIPYIVGCIVVFGAFAIWKIVVTILSGV